MPYVFVSTQIRLECGPTICGDEQSDPELMHYLGATLTKQFGNNFKEWRTDLLPRVVLDRLEAKGYRVISATGMGQTMVWTMHKKQVELNTR
ncbi:GTP cyclohydrolase 1 feedback regulatory protein-like isoform X3 [Acanthaster planci]|uniref:GTP cyclohydrolase 1 feedback regulatory protein n=1 Tax=Acanthaster planci TaxID=133434 RepID=A0A8B7Z6P3_ACAPL|nr:GTP cyclohydrolase 1 feedback regulatory protein-like isoform X3 [Acanthaster planci]